MEIEEGPEGDPATATACAEKWKAAQADEQSGAFVRWEQTGVFSSVCRHGIAVLLVDMRRSSEL